VSFQKNSKLLIFAINLYRFIRLRSGYRHWSGSTANATYNFWSWTKQSETRTLQNMGHTVRLRYPHAQDDLPSRPYYHKGHCTASHDTIRSVSTVITPKVGHEHVTARTGHRLRGTEWIYGRYTKKGLNSAQIGRGQLKCDGTRAETRFRLSAKRTSLFKSAGASVQSTTGSRGMRISGSNAGYTTFRGRVKSTGYPLHSSVSLSLPFPCVTVCHHISTGAYLSPT